MQRALLAIALIHSLIYALSIATRVAATLGCGHPVRIGLASLSSVLFSVGII